jgi:hypothetical protein
MWMRIAIVCFYFFTHVHHGETFLIPVTTATRNVSSRHSAPYDNTNVDAKHHYFDQSISPLNKAGGALYRQSVFTKEEFETIYNEVSSITSSNRLNEEKSSTAQHRLGASLTQDSETVHILKEGSLHALVQRLAQDSSLELSSHLPVEVRVYQTTGSGMSWHIDDVLYEPKPQLEVVITLENTSDCVTMWKKENDEKSMQSQETDPNSVLVLKAGGPLHCVTSLKRGRRMILKCAYVSKDSAFREGIHTDQFGGAKGKVKKHKKGRSKR